MSTILTISFLVGMEIYKYYSLKEITERDRIKYEKDKSDRKRYWEEQEERVKNIK